MSCCDDDCNDDCKQQQKSSCIGIFGALFGGGGGSGCSSCGTDSCNCNCELKSHLKDCCDLGKLPPLIEKCSDIPGPGYRDRVPRSTCNDNKCGGDQKSKSDCKPCEPKKSEKKDDCGCGCDKKKDDSCERGKAEKCEKTHPKDKCSKCPPMPVTDCCNCKPAWLDCPPPCRGKIYPVPKGVTIIPISQGGRRGGGGKGGSCKKCGQERTSDKPNVSNKNCPMMRPKCPGMEQKDGGGTSVFAKIASLFGKK